MAWMPGMGPLRLMRYSSRIKHVRAYGISATENDYCRIRSSAPPSCRRIAAKYRSCGSYGGEHIVFERTFVCFNPVLFVRLLFVRAFDSGYLFESRRCVDRVSGGVSSDRTISPNLSQFLRGWFDWASRR